MDIKSIMPLITAVKAPPAKSGVGATPGTPSFSNVLQDALSKVSETQNQVGKLQRDYQMGKEGASLEQTMVAMQKAQVEFQAAVTVRNRLVSAYTEIMNMSV